MFNIPQDIVVYIYILGLNRYSCPDKKKDDERTWIETR